ncbi:MAG TPA: PIG-L family deacetylase [Nitrososphaerales archaeon]|nr:PIG-L family deacetylase [Nitrososphaerales archaeon]
MQQKYRNLVVSPHIDDAFLSLGGMLAKEASRKQKILNVFTITKFAPRGKCPKGDIVCVSKLRKEEELLNCRSVAAEVNFLEFLDAPIRLQKGLDAIDFDSEKRTSDGIKEKIRIDLHDSERVFFPLAIGRHIDHVLICKIGLELITEGDNPSNIYFYEDQPYSARKHKAYSLIDPNINMARMRHSFVSISFRKKWKLMTTYQSQFSNRIYREVVVYAKRIRPLGTFYERIWQIADPALAAEILVEKAKKDEERKMNPALKL